MFKNTGKHLEEINHFKTDIRTVNANNLNNKMHKRIPRNGVNRLSKMWPNGLIPYAISSDYNDHERALLARAFKQVSVNKKNILKIMKLKKFYLFKLFYYYLFLQLYFLSFFFLKKFYLINF